jgi:hypothetical protein
MWKVSKQGRGRKVRHEKQQVVNGKTTRRRHDARRRETIHIREGIRKGIF